MKIVAAVILSIWLLALLGYVVFVAGETFTGPWYIRIIKGLGLVLGIAAFACVGGFCLEVLSK